MDSLILEITDLGRIVRRAFDRRAATLGATRAQWRLLVLLGRNDGGARQVDLADALDIEPMTLCRMVDRMEAQGLVERRRDERDRRAWLIHLTPAAQPLVERLRTLGAGFFADALDGVSDEEAAVVHRVLARVRANLANADASVRKSS